MRAYLKQLKQKIATWLLRHGTSLVDLEWYCSHSPVSRLGKRAPLLHYWLFGSDKSAQAHPLFDNQYFAEQCQKAGLPVPNKPLKVYLGNREYWNINPHPLFDAAFYYQQTGSDLSTSPLMHYINGGHTQYSPHPLFSNHWYFISFPGLKTMQQHCPLVHYMKIGHTNAVSTHPLFHADFYAKSTGIQIDNDKTHINTLLHFVTSKENNISCHPLFDLDLFKQQIEKKYKDLTASELIIKQYLLQPSHWQYNTHLLFDSSFYQQQSSGIKTDKSPLEEYIAHNFSVRNPHPLFNTHWYQSRKKNILKFSGQGRVPLIHFVLNGYQMGESPSPLFSLQWYRHTYMEGKRSDTNPLIEFITQGEAAGNRPNPIYPTNWREWLFKKHNCSTLADYAAIAPIGTPNLRNRISDAFSTPYINEQDSTTKTYLILFTPRSGSSWLTDLITQQKILGRPAEWFNPDLMQSAMNGLPKHTHNIYEFCQELQNTHKSRENYFGAELTATHLSMLSDLINIQQVFNQPSYIVLLRRNIVAQGISLFLATETGFFHSTNTINKDNQLQYNEKKIKKWINEILNDEKYIHRFIEKNQLNPLYIWHEDIKENTEESIQTIINHITGNKLNLEPITESEHKKIGSNINHIFEEKFRSENKDYISKIEHKRLFTTSSTRNITP